MEISLVKKSVSLLNEYLYQNLPHGLYKKITDTSHSEKVKKSYSEKVKKSYSEKVKKSHSEKVEIVDLKTLSNSLQKKIIKLPNQKVVFGNLTFFYSNEKTKISFDTDTVFFGKKVTRNDIIEILLLLLKNFGIKLEFTNKKISKNSNQNVIDCTNIIKMLKNALENKKKYMSEGGTRRKRGTKKYNYRKKKSLKKFKSVGGDPIRKFLLILFRILICGTIVSSINFSVNPTKYNGNIFTCFGIGTLCVILIILTNNMYNPELEYNELDISRGSTASITTLGDDNDLEDPLEINLTPVNSETPENDIIDINDILLELFENHMDIL